MSRRESSGDILLLTGRFADQKSAMIKFCEALLTDCGFSDSGYSASRVRAARLNSATTVPMPKLKRRKLMTVTTNMAAVARLEKPLRL